MANSPVADISWFNIIRISDMVWENSARYILLKNMTTPHCSSQLSKVSTVFSSIFKSPTSQQHSCFPKKQQHPPIPNIHHTPQMLYLQVNQKFLCILPIATATQPNPPVLPPLPGTTGNLNVIDLHPFSGNTVDWLIQVARLIFDQLGTSSLYTFTT